MSGLECAFVEAVQVGQGDALPTPGQANAAFRFVIDRFLAGPRTEEHGEGHFSRFELEADLPPV
jgi:hypothetical protein